MGHNNYTTATGGFGSGIFSSTSGSAISPEMRPQIRKTSLPPPGPIPPIHIDQVDPGGGENNNNGMIGMKKIMNGGKVAGGGVGGKSSLTTIASQGSSDYDDYHVEDDDYELPPEEDGKFLTVERITGEL
jgi:hypothetical protein